MDQPLVLNDASDRFWSRQIKDKSKSNLIVAPPKGSLLKMSEVANWTAPFFIPANETLPPRTKLHLNVHLSCPTPPRMALIAILTIPSFDNTARRSYQRIQYALENRRIQNPKDKIDFVYFFGKPYSPESKFQMNLEFNEHPEDTIITDRYEDRDDGKVLDWFEYARSQMYIPHPTLNGEWCLRYQYIGKSDDDSVIHVSRLSSILKKLPNGSNYVGRVSYPNQRNQHMTGMLYLLTSDIVEWINDSPIPESNKIGVEDVNVGQWLWDGNLDVELIHRDREFHNLPSAPYFQRRIDNDSVVVHYCKHLEQFFECMKGLYDPTPPIITIDHYLVHPEMINYRVKFQFGLNITNETEQYIFEEIYFKVKETPLKLPEYDNILLESSIESALEMLGLADVEQNTRKAMIDKIREASYDKWLVNDEVLHLILESFLASRMNEMGIRVVDSSTYFKERISSLLVWVLQDPERAIRMMDFVIMKDYVMGRGFVLGKYMTMDVAAQIANELLWLVGNGEKADEKIVDGVILKYNK
ncbi:UNVERIFIED_CONTAM: hypothetical protein HDU68_009232 [Siphonaria sp. JEL0065]|nr:hypothetical protein HDU68_009232 [Siphonaria sp. JEL0065]